MARKKKQRKTRRLHLLDALLTAIDWLCEGVSDLLVALIRGVFRALLWVLCGAGRLVIWALRVACMPVGWLWRRLPGRYLCAEQCIKLTGEEFESYVALVLRDNGFKKVEVTKASGDQGADVLAERNGIFYAIQCKNYEGAVGNFAVQEAYAAAQFYQCDRAAVICPGEFTRGAKELAEATGVTLWDGTWLTCMMRRSGRRPRHRAE